MRSLDMKLSARHLQAATIDHSGPMSVHSRSLDTRGAEIPGGGCGTLRAVLAIGLGVLITPLAMLPGCGTMDAGELEGSESTGTELDAVTTQHEDCPGDSDDDPGSSGGPSPSEVGHQGQPERSDVRVITTDGTDLDGIEVQSGLVIRADDVTITNSYIKGNTRLVVDCDGCRNLVIEDSTIEGTGTQTQGCIGRSSFTARRVHISGCIDGAKTNGNVVIEDSWIGGLRRVGSSHNDGIQSTGGHNIVIRNNTIVHDTGGQTSAVKLTSENQDLTGVELVDNDLVSSTCYAVYFTAKNGHAPPTGRITGNTVSGHTCSQWLKLTAGSGQTISGNTVF